MVLLLFLHGHFNESEFIGDGLFAHGDFARVRQSIESFFSPLLLKKPARRFWDKKDSREQHNWGPNLDNNRYGLVSAGVWTRSRQQPRTRKVGPLVVEACNLTVNSGGCQNGADVKPGLVEVDEAAADRSWRELCHVHWNSIGLDTYIDH